MDFTHSNTATQALSFLSSYGEPESQKIKALLQSSIDPDRVARLVEQFALSHPAHFDALLKNGEQLRWVTTVFGFSHFLSEELLRRPEWIFSVGDLDRTLSLPDYRVRLAAFQARHGARTASALELALFRRKELLRIVLRDALNLGSLPQLTEEISNLADAILGCALQSVKGELEVRFGLPQCTDASGQDAHAAFTVIALGKLGGCELNYSSDIDLMFLYRDNGETSGPQKISNQEFFKKVANQLTGLLSTYTAAGLCYRVDLRLRPEGSLGEVCLSLAAAQDYYASRARDWELQMLIKARVAAGNESIGQALLESVEPSIYSTTLDFSAIETMSATRERIGEKVARRRHRKEGLDVKLSRGGIRDIEFLVQCLQRLHGARETWVRHGGTLLALSRLLDKDLLSSTEYRHLVDAYTFLRHLEHRLQFEDDRQTHTLPSGQLELDRIARRMPQNNSRLQGGITAGAQLLGDLNGHLESVVGIYERIVHAQRPLYYSLSVPAVPPLEALESDNRRASGEAPREGPKEHSVSVFLKSLSKDAFYLSLLNGHPVVADYAIQILKTSPFLAEQLTTHADLLEEIQRIADYPTRRWAFEGMAAPLNDIDALRRFFRREMFRIQAGSICLTEPVFQTLDRTSALAEFVIARAYRIALERALSHARLHSTAEKPFNPPQSEMMVVALGRLGMREFDLGSDADLLFIIPDSEAERLQFWTRVTENLIEIVTAYTGEGTIISLDTRLRPDGREGMLVQTESKYVEYFSTKAEAWEGIAYMKARAVAGDVERATEFLNELQQVDWRRYGQGGRSKQDLRQMRMRLQREQGAASPLKAGFGGYYDSDFILMYLRLKGAGLFFKSLNTPERIDIVEKMGHLERDDAEFLLQATTFYRALDHALRIVAGRAEQKLPVSEEQQEMVADLMGRWTGWQHSASNLEAELAALQSKMRDLFDSLFAH